MSAVHSLIVADNEHPPRAEPARPRSATSPKYEPGHSARQATGSVALAEGSWTATLAVPMRGDQTVLLTLQREGPAPPGTPSTGQVALIIPLDEINAVLALINGVVAQSRRDGVLDAGAYQP